MHEAAHGWWRAVTGISRAISPYDAGRRLPSVSVSMVSRPDRKKREEKRRKRKERKGKANEKGSGEKREGGMRESVGSADKEGISRLRRLSVPGQGSRGSRVPEVAKARRCLPPRKLETRASCKLGCRDLLGLRIPPCFPLFPKLSFHGAWPAIT